MAAETEQIPIVIRPRPVPKGPQRWVEWITVPEHRSAQKATGRLLTSAAVGGGILLVIVYEIASQNGTRLPGAIVMALLAGAGSVVNSLFYRAKRIKAPHALETLQKDRRAPLLLLRAFRDDFQGLGGYIDPGGVLTFGQQRPRTFEEFLYDCLLRAGPVIAIGRPGERTPPLGASRFWVRDDLWRQVVDEILQEAQYVVLIMGSLGEARTVVDSELGQYLADLEGRARGSDREDGAPGSDVEQYLATLERSARAEAPAEPDGGLTWEANRLFGLKDLQKVILVMPPIDDDQAARRWQQYQELSEGLLPPFKGGEIAATFGADRTCRVARIEKTGRAPYSYARNARAYQASIDVRAC